MATMRTTMTKTKKMRKKAATHRAAARQVPVFTHREKSLGEKKPGALRALGSSFVPGDEEHAQFEKRLIKTLCVGMRATDRLGPAVKWDGQKTLTNAPPPSKLGNGSDGSQREHPPAKRPAERRRFVAT
jgi:hypothetical protein